MLGSLDELLADLCCPRCGGGIVGLGEGRPMCVECQQQYLMVDRCPVFIDFNESIIDAEQLTATRGASRLAREARGRSRRLAGHEQVIARNIRRLEALLPPSSRVLIVGGGVEGNGISPLIISNDITVYGFDVYASAATQFVADAHAIPLRSASFDAVIIQAVLEHVLDPAQVVSEIHRVLRPKGLVYAETPFMQHVHEGPYDFTRFSESGHRWLFRNFACIDGGPIGGPGLSGLWALDYAVRAVTGSRRQGLRVRKLFAGLASRLDQTVGATYLVDSACAVYFLGRRSERQTIQPRDMVNYYRGAQGGN